MLTKKNSPVSKNPKKLIIGNWKMNPISEQEAKKVVAKILSYRLPTNRVDTIICPPAIYLSSLIHLAKNKVKFGAQDISSELYGAYTGGLSAFMFRDLGVRYVIVGHSERRAQGETDELINRKVRLALQEDLKVILCIGEAERDESGEYLTFLSRQLESALDGVPKKLLTNLIIAHEPVWAIGDKAKGADTPENFLHNKLFLRRLLTNLVSKSVALEIPIIYGGSVSVKNAELFLRTGEADGLLVGRASLEPDQFVEIIHLAQKV